MREIKVYVIFNSPGNPLNEIWKLRESFCSSIFVRGYESECFIPTSGSNQSSYKGGYAWIYPVEIHNFSLRNVHVKLSLHLSESMHKIELLPQRRYDERKFSADVNLAKVTAATIFKEVNGGEVSEDDYYELVLDGCHCHRAVGILPPTEEIPGIDRQLYMHLILRWDRAGIDQKDEVKLCEVRSQSFVTVRKDSSFVYTTRALLS